MGRGVKTCGGTVIVVSLCCCILVGVLERRGIDVRFCCDANKRQCCGVMLRIRWWS
jgi:hypothetical protein